MGHKIALRNFVVRYSLGEARPAHLEGGMLISKAGVDIDSTLAIENSDKIIFLVMSMGVIRRCVVS